MPKVARKLATSVTFDPEVVQYVDTIARKEERTRSQVINRIIKKHAQQNGGLISPAGNGAPGPKTADSLT